MNSDEWKVMPIPTIVAEIYSCKGALSICTMSSMSGIFRGYVDAEDINYN